VSARYTYGDSEIAGERLRLLAEVYGSSSLAFLRELVERPIGVAVDLGCGPGGTTALLAEALTPERLIGVDRSERFLEEASGVVAGAEFVVHDVSDVPFPWGRADLLYCRFVLGHLPEPMDVLESWVTQLEPGGIVAVEEYERIESSHPVVARYLEISEAMVAAEGATLRLGPVLDAASSLPDAEVVVNGVVTFDPGAARIARIFLLNLPTMRENRFVGESFGAEAIDEVEVGLGDLIASPVPVSAAVRQLAVRRHV